MAEFVDDVIQSPDWDMAKEDKEHINDQSKLENRKLQNDVFDNLFVPQNPKLCYHNIH